MPGGKGAADGFSLLIKEPGKYKLKGLIVEALSGTGVQDRAGFFGAPNGAFYAQMPLVLRPRHKEDRIREAAVSGAGQVFTAEDSAGPAAFIGMKKGRAEVLLRREGEQYAPGIFLITISGVIDA